MTAAEFRAALKRLKLSLVGFAREVGAIGGEPVPRRTVQSWALGEYEPPPTAVALLVLMERAPEAWRQETTPPPSPADRPPRSRAARASR